METIEINTETFAADLNNIGLSYSKVARHCGVSKSYVGQIMNGSRTQVSTWFLDRFSSLVISHITRIYNPIRYTLFSPKTSGRESDLKQDGISPLRTESDPHSSQMCSSDPNNNNSSTGPHENKVGSKDRNREAPHGRTSRTAGESNAGIVGT